MALLRQRQDITLGTNLDLFGVSSKKVFRPHDFGVAENLQSSDKKLSQAP